MVSGTAGRPRPCPPRTAQPATPARVPGRRRWPRRLAYVFLIGYAMLMFVPFAWSVITSFKTLPDSVQLSLIPDPFTLDAYDYVFNELDPSLPRLFFNSGLIAGAVTLTQRRPRAASPATPSRGCGSRVARCCSSSSWPR